MDEKNNKGTGRWVLVVPAIPLALVLAVIISAPLVPALSLSHKWMMPAAAIAPLVWSLSPFVGIWVLGALFWGWLKDRVELTNPRVLAGITLSVLDIAIPLGVLYYLLKDIDVRGWG